jgi:hypothetical protein
MKREIVQGQPEDRDIVTGGAITDKPHVSRSGACNLFVPLQRVILR